MEIISPNTDFPFIPNRRFGYVVSGTLIAATIVMLFVRGGLNYGIDFAGGVNVHVRFASAVPLA